MNSHLSPEQISRWMMGERTRLEEQHVRECPRCGAEVAVFQSALDAFRSSVRGWSDGQSVVKPVRDGLRARPLRWAWIAATVLLLAAIPIYRLDQQRKAERAKADAALLEQVDVQVSRAIAAPMEPLAKLMTWDEER
jgi:hypothetical protein